MEKGLKITNWKEVKILRKFISQFDEQKQWDILTDILINGLKPKGFYKYKRYGWNTGSGNPPNKIKINNKIWEFDFGT